MSFRYEGRVRFQDVEPGVGGDLILLVDHPDASEFDPVCFDSELQNWLNEGFLSCGPSVGPLRITVERLDPASSSRGARQTA